MTAVLMMPLLPASDQAALDTPARYEIALYQAWAGRG